LYYTDSEHKLVNLDDLIKELINIDELTSAEDKMSAHFKQLSQTLSDFDTETDKLLNILHTQRDEHVRLLLVECNQYYMDFR